MERRWAITSDGPLGQRGVQRPLDRGLALAVEVGGRLVQDDQGLGLQQQPGDGQALLLPAGEPVAAVADDGLQAFREGLTSGPTSGRPSGLPPSSASVAVRLGIEQVGADRVVEEVRPPG